MSEVTQKKSSSYLSSNPLSSSPISSDWDGVAAFLASSGFLVFEGCGLDLADSDASNSSSKSSSYVSSILLLFDDSRLIWVALPKVLVWGAGSSVFGAPG